MIVKKEGRYNKIEGLDIEIFSNDESHHISIYNDKKDTSVSFSIHTAMSFSKDSKCYINVWDGNYPKWIEVKDND